MASKDLSRLTRILQIYDWLLADAEFDCDDLADHFHVGRRTVLRDMAALRNAGVSLEFDRRWKTYRLGQSGPKNPPRRKRRW